MPTREFSSFRDKVRFSLILAVKRLLDETDDVPAALFGTNNDKVQNHPISPDFLTDETALAVLRNELIPEMVRKHGYTYIALALPAIDEAAGDADAEEGLFVHCLSGTESEVWVAPIVRKPLRPPHLKRWKFLGHHFTHTSSLLLPVQRVLKETRG